MHVTQLIWCRKVLSVVRQDVIITTDSAHEAEIIHFLVTIVSRKNRPYSEEPLNIYYILFYCHIESGPDSYPVLTGLQFGNWPPHRPSQQKSQWVKASLRSHILSAQEEVF